MSEHQQQVALFQWADTMINLGYQELDLMYAVPNGGKRDGSQGAWSKAEGLKKGVPDVVLAWPMMPYHGFYLEMKDKTVKGSKVKPDQEKWMAKLKAAGYFVDVAWDWEEAAQKLCSYIKKEYQS